VKVGMRILSFYSRPGYYMRPLSHEVGEKTGRRERERE